MIKKFSVTDLCGMASEQHPEKWPREILDFYPEQEISIFGSSFVLFSGEMISLIDSLVLTGLYDSNGNARKGIKGNGVMVNRVKVLDINKILTINDVLPNLDAVVIERGKYNFGIIRFLRV